MRWTRICGPGAMILFCRTPPRAGPLPAAGIDTLEGFAGTHSCSHAGAAKGWSDRRRGSWREANHRAISLLVLETAAGAGFRTPAVRRLFGHQRDAVEGC